MHSFFIGFSSSLRYYSASEDVFLLARVGFFSGAAVSALGLRPRFFGASSTAAGTAPALAFLAVPFAAAFSTFVTETPAFSSAFTLGYGLARSLT